ncbi:MAG: flagellar hook protein FlgE [Clostridiaceae bacterium]|nr:flagellar hook protein FlgE [Clostridiaceae bacterium]
MMMSMYASVSGLKAHQICMDVIGNNIANVNTVGFKASRATFQEIFSQTLSPASTPDEVTGRGGTNPMQVGLGMNIDAIDVQMNRGSVQRTESPTDLSIEGEGFFIVRSGSDGEFLFTRAGNFTIDKQGNLVTSSGQNVYGWMKYEYGDNGYVFDTQEPIMPLNLYSDIYNSNKRIISAKATTIAVLSGNLDATVTPVGGYTGKEGEVATIDTILDAVGPDGTPGSDGIPDGGTENSTNFDPHFIVPVSVYDDLGNEYKLTIKFWKNFTQSVTGPDGETTVETSWYYVIDGGSNATATQAASGFIKFDSKGRLIKDDLVNFNYKPTIEITPSIAMGSQPFSFELNMEQLSMFADDSSVKTTRVDGYPPGTLVTFSIGSDGVITGVYDNGRQQPLGQIALATFENPAGLQKVGANQFAQTPNSGDFKVGKQPGHDGAGVLIPGTLEMSNVDLAKQFTEMIITQRGFQANSRVMTTSDEILQELANMKR